MAGKDTERQSDKADEQKQSRIAMAFYRWIFLLLAVLFVLADRNEGIPYYTVLETIAVAVVYNIIETLRLYKNRKAGNRIAIAVVYMDIVFLSLFSYLSGGMKSNIFILLFFVLFYCGILGEAPQTLKASVFCAVFYTVSSLYALKTNLQLSAFLVLAAKDILILLGAFGITRVRGQVKKFEELRKKEFRLARTDRLTGLANRHYFDQKLPEEAHHADMTEGKLNILIFDLDNFKRFNDSYGHVAGDKLLALFADIIMQNIRKTDIPVRYGGEEFLLLIRDLDITIAKSVGDRIRRQLEKQKIYINDSSERRMMTVSCGVAQYPSDSSNVKEVVELADRALYHAKENGKNVVFTYDELCRKGA